jgi:hypothetical protein
MLQTKCWSLEDIQAVSIQYECRADFFQDHPNLREFARSKGWLHLLRYKYHVRQATTANKKARRRGRDLSTKPTQELSLEQIQAEAAECIDVNELRLSAPAAYKQAKDKGWLNQLEYFKLKDR